MLPSPHMSLSTLAIAWFLVYSCAVDAAETSDVEFFETKIRPILVRECYECHSHASAEVKGGLLLDSRDGIRRGGESGAAVVPHAVDKSLLMSALRHESFEMPPGKKLPKRVIDDFARWIDLGAVDPRDKAPEPEVVANEIWQQAFDQRQEWWSLQPLQSVDVRQLPTASEDNQTLDRFIHRKLAQHHLHQAPRAARATLARRLSFTLLGLPPDAHAVDRFVADPSPTAYDEFVDRLLSSPHFGERFARHWMDVVRYTDTYGYEWDVPAKGAWRYRDYLIRAFNADVPFDQLVREQIAGDLLAVPRMNDTEQVNESLMGVMFFQMGEKRHGDSADFNGVHQEMLDNKIDAFSKAFQATTIACARCHNHKLDAVSQAEYYALAGIFMSARWITNTVDQAERNSTTIAELERLKRDLRDLIADQWQQDASGFGKLLQKIPSDQLQKQARQQSDPMYVWRKLHETADSQDIAHTWQQLAAEYTTQRDERTAANQAHFRTIADFRMGIPDGWHVDGVGIRQTPAGEFSVALQGERVVANVLPAGLTTHSLSPRLNGVLRTPYLAEYGNAHISFEHIGGDFAAHRTVIDNAFLTEKQGYLNALHPTWARLATHGHRTERRTFIEFATKSSNPNFPPRVGLGAALTQEQIASPESWFGVSRVVIHQAPHTPVDELDRFVSLFEGPAPRTLAAAADHIARWLRQSVDAWATGKTNDDHVLILNWLLANGWLTNEMRSSNALQASVERYRDVEQGLAIPWTTNGMADLDPGYDVKLNVRGDYDQLGDQIPRGYLAALRQTSSKLRAADDSGRRQLADQVASPTNPLTARVYVNRVWQWLFGSAIVTTPNDFGHLGDVPSHPELLDQLTHEFIASGWSTKWLVRTIVTSRAWCQAGLPSSEALQHDPKNRLRHHYPTRRLEAEAIRDAILAASGTFDRQLYGEPIDPYRVNEDPQKRLSCGPLDGHGRRSLYTKVTIMEPARFLATFNQPEPKLPTGRRDVTNTPAQALALLNDPFVISQAKRWSEHVVAARHETVRGRLDAMFRSAYSRRMTEAEATRWIAAINGHPKQVQSTGTDVMQDVDLWKDIAHILINTKEFIYIR